MTSSRHATKYNGFTLIELLIVIAIIGLLATLAIVSLTTAQQKARDTKRLADLKTLQDAVELYYREYDTFPITDATTNATWSDFANSVTPFITNMPIDETNDDALGYVYTYASSDDGSEYVIAAKLEKLDHDALNADDDSLYDSANVNWNNLDAVESDDLVNEVVTTVDCGTTSPDSTSGAYCVSE